MIRPAAVLALSLLLSCSRDDRIAIVVYSPHGPDILEEFERSFEREHPEADVRAFNMPTVQILTRLRAESANPQADVWWGAPRATFQRAADEGLLEPYRPSWIDAVDEALRDAEDRFAPHFLIPQVLVYNARLLPPEQAPREWDDLVSPAWHGRLVFRAPLESGSMRTAFTWLVAWKASRAGGDLEAGFAFLERLHRATKRYVANPKELFEAIARDADRVCTIWNLADAVFQRDRYGYPFGISIPDSGVPLAVDCIALVRHPGRSERREDLARAFYEHVTSLDAGRILMHEHGRILCRRDVPAEDKPDWHEKLSFRPLPIDPDLPGRHEDEWMRRWDRTIKPLPHPSR